MSVANCPSCGHEIEIPDTKGNAFVRLNCPSCRAAIEFSIAFDGAETVLHSETGRDADPSATVPFGSSTSILDGGEAAGDGEVPETVFQASLVVAGKGPPAGRYPLGSGVTTVGRTAADIVLPDEAISSLHFQIERRGGEFVLRDLGSSNGTFVNGERVQSALLAAGDSIDAGTTTLVLRLVEAIAVDPGE